MRRLLATVLLAAALTGCATNPVTGKADVVTMSVAQEAEIGRKTHPQVLQQYGRYEDEALQAYVSDIGQRLMTTDVLALELIAVVLTAALIGAVVLAMGEPRGHEAEPPP